MSEEKTAQALTKDDFSQAVAQAGGPEAVPAAFDGLRLANAQTVSPALDRHGARRHDCQRPSPRGLLRRR